MPANVIETMNGPLKHNSKARRQQGLKGLSSKTLYRAWRAKLVTDRNRSSRRVQTPLDFTILHNKTRTARLCFKLLEAEPLQTFNNNYEKVKADWDWLKDKTNIPNVTSSSDHRIVCSFKVIDLVIGEAQSSTLLRRLAYVRLMDLLSFLEEVISFERKSGRMIRERYYTNASIALDIYMTAQEDLSNPDVLRRELQERTQVGKWWKTLSKPSPLLVLMYSEAADSIM